ncbi:hypothetical protein N7520_001967 [Penicillium odoratum]|uniref:uncharacterized protein n=1 Tax=Penicillium odoratum TaxID=1167516 RepID=UPI00254693EC|nr:uncharacterized protein N7520_001967 [Penicillium odoratum]KAJ5778721.1 hypothetical protein N7520_001967 [Penicillium odoratum]
MVWLKTGALQRLAHARNICARGALRQRQGALQRLPCVRDRLISTTRVLGSDHHTEQEPIFTRNTLIDQSQSVPQTLHKAEIEAYRDIRGYLSNWQANNPNLLDPIREPNHDLDSGPVMGNMPNGRDNYGDNVWNNPGISHEDDMDTSEEFHGDHLEPGDMVAELLGDGTFRWAIYVQSIQRRPQFYTTRGNWRLCKARELDYVIKGFAPPELLDAIKPYFPNTVPLVNYEIQSVPEGGVPRPLGAPLLEMMNNFQAHVLDFYRLNSAKLDNMHDLVADDSEFRRLSIEELTMKVLDIEESELNSVNLFVVHQAVRNNSFLIEKDSTSLFSFMYLVQPKRIAKTVETVTTWVHEHQDYLTRFAMRHTRQTYHDQIATTTSGMTADKFSQHPIQRFTAKAQRLIRLSRRSRSPTIMSSVGPTSQQFKAGQDGKAMVFREVLTEQFDRNDQIIIEYLQLYATPSVIMPSGTLKSTASHIMRVTGMYNTLGLSDTSTRIFLQELGVISPWENLSLLDQNLMLPGHGVSLLEDMRWEEIEESCKDADSLVDSMQHLRKDWGNLPVYCIDDVTAQEIDDAVSLERIPASEDTFWVHIHVANPTAFLQNNDPIIEYAASRLATTYAPERTYPIFPESLTQGHFSLAPGRPALTFSAKMNLDGEILDTAVANGTVHNVISLTHRTLRKYLNPDFNESQETLTVGNLIDTPLPRGKDFRETLTAEDKDTFTILRKLMLGFRTQRQKNGAMDMQSLRPNMLLTVQAGTEPLKPYEIQVTEGRLFIGDPTIQLRIQDSNPHEVRDESKVYLVSMLMNLAGHIAGQFCATRNIPAVYDGTWYDPEYERVTPENMSQFGGQKFLHLAMPRAFSSSEPVHHHMLGLDAYIKSTSPLRRFTDVIAHYQIEAALRFEAEHGRPFDGVIDMLDQIEEAHNQALPAETEAEAESTSKYESESNSPPLPYTKSDIDSHILFSAPIRARLREVSNYSNQHWACMLLFRAFYFAGCPLPETFPVVLRMPRVLPVRDGTVYSGVIANLGVGCSVTITDDCPDKERMNIFGIVDAKIVAVDMASLEVKMEAVGLIREYERVGEWA